MEQIIAEFASKDPMFWVAALASVVGLTLYYLYSGYINKNYRHLKWLRRLFLPHVTRIIRKIDKSNEDIHLGGLYVESFSPKKYRVFDLYLSEDTTKEEAIECVDQKLLSNHFRPEIILASLASNNEGNVELGNFVLTAPERKHPDVKGFGKLYDIAMMFAAKHQLHVRYYYDEDKHRLRFYAHYESNPYNPFISYQHYEGDGMRKAAEIFKEYQEEIANCGVEVSE